MPAHPHNLAVKRNAGVPWDKRYLLNFGLLPVMLAEFGTL